MPLYGHATNRASTTRAICIIVALLLLTGCARPTQDGLQGAKSTATATAAPVSACNQLLGMSGAGFVQIDYLDFPEDGIGVGAITSPAGAPMEVDEYDLCLQIKRASIPDPAPVKTVLTAINVGGRGWASYSSFPFDGVTPRPCSTEQVCFRSLNSYLLVENVRVYTGKFYTFHLRRALIAPLVQCDPVLFPHATYPKSISPAWAAEIPLPPLTRVSVGESVGEGTITYLCSAGTPESITTFMNQRLPKYGWTKVTVAGKRLWKTTDSSPTLYLAVNAVTDPRHWSIIEYGSNFNS
jgi:hypothetical protein